MLLEVAERYGKKPSEVGSWSLIDYVEAAEWISYKNEQMAKAQKKKR